MNNLTAWLVIAYTIGSIPTGFWFAKYFFDIDVTKHGSGNIGATNVARVLGSQKYFFLIFLLDFFKAWFALVLIDWIYIEDLELVIFSKQYFIKYYIFAAAICVLLGNSYSMFMGYKGGKGVATTLGILFFFAPIKLFLFFILCWAFILLVFRRVDIASLSAMFLSSMFYYCFFVPIDFSLFYFLLFLCIWITLRHKNNILSLLKK
jgi:acyl phosphate:glycerol-3-phosphate acyltransferase